MRPLTLQEMAAAMAGRVLGPIKAPTVSGVSTDSREDVRDSLFFAITGPRFDGHAFVEQVLKNGATAAVVSDLSVIAPSLQNDGRLIQVMDTVQALGKLAAWYRRQFAAQAIAVVGSNGKTSTKDMIHAVLGSKRPGQAAKASFNNAVGVPLTLLSVEPTDEYVVVEIGTNHPGEVASLGAIAQPDMAVVTSIGEEHLEFFGDIGAVAREEFSILTSMRNRSLIALSEQAAAYAPLGGPRDYTMLKYGFGNGADLRAELLGADRDGQRFAVNGRFKYRLPLLGRHNVVNAMAAIAVGTRFRMAHDEIAAALADVEPPPMRMELQKIGEITVVNDAYNANPASMRAAFDTLDQMKSAGRKVLVLGDMRELGHNAPKCHQAVGRDAGRSTANVIIAAGAFARVVTDGATAVAETSKRIYAYPSVEALEAKIRTLLVPGDVVLLKASRGVRLERIMDSLRDAAVCGTPLREN
ncbi:MAG: UDP-N-acetylmuramoyl-tripeptide--D-alanyl-D-alanine ligase [Planctomycetota bacterium]